MKFIDGRPVYSATDLVGFLACEHLTNLERAALQGLVKRPMRVDAELDRIAKRGTQHEQRFLGDLRAEGLSITEIQPDGSISDRGEQLRDAAAQTLAAMKDGKEVIYQATFFDGSWRGHADFLRKVDVPSALGDWSYEAWDTKLARHTKGSAILQLCLYTDLLAKAQGRQPELIHVALGGGARPVEHYRVEDFAAYFRLVRSNFLEFVGAGEPAYPPLTRPDPVEHCDVCRWSLACKDARRAADDLSIVAGITAKQRRVLRDAGISTRRGLAATPLPLGEAIVGAKRDRRESLTRVREQARIQVDGDSVAPRVLHELLDLSRTKDGAFQANRGLLSLPTPSSGDLFFDIEGDPFALDDGVDYLFGVLEPGLRDGDGNATFHTAWSIDEDEEVTADAERRAFETVIDLFTDRLEKDPRMHIYHYAPYEPTAIGRLMGRYGTRESEVDRLLRGDVFVDLFRAVRQGVRASVESYSIKRLEPLYGFERTIDLRDAGSSIVAFETWLELGGDADDDPDILPRIEAYNKDDCVSTWLLRDWLEVEREKLALRVGQDLPRPVPKTPDAGAELTEALARVKQVADRLTTDWSVEGDVRSPELHGRWLLAQILSWHRREEKSTWWRYHYLMDDLTDDERRGESDAMGGLLAQGVTREEKQSFVYLFTFPPQEHAIGVGTDVYDPETGKQPGEVVAINEETGTIELKRSKKSEPPDPTSLVPLEHVGTREQRDSLMRIGSWVAEHGIDGPGQYRAARELLLRRSPRAAVEPGATLLRPDELAREAARRLVIALDESYLAIQGPPGSGKTSIGAEMIVDLVEQRKRVGVTANSHKVIGHLLAKATKVAAKRGRSLAVGQKAGADGQCSYADARCFGSNAEARDALAAGEVDVLGGTAWVWSREDFAEAVDVLFVDEAGQMSLANAIAVSPGGASLVLLGDPQQLDQPLKGSHPPGAERSALAHILDGRQTMPAHLGLFLERTWRLHPDICAFTSEVFYESRLEPEPGRELQDLAGAPPLGGTGIRFVPVAHEGHDNDSAEEAGVLAHLISDLLDAAPTWTDDEASVHPLRLEDVLIITPYNAQVRMIGEALPGAHAGTVDKFQGQEAPISIYSMATSSAEEAPRGMEFLYSLHRLNVATSRARCLTAVVASPELIRVRCRTPRQMQLANGLARLVEMAQGSALKGIDHQTPNPEPDPRASAGQPSAHPAPPDRPAVVSASGLRVASVAQGLAMAANSDARLLLLVGQSPEAIRRAAEVAAEELGWPLIDLNLQLSERLLPFTAQERRDEAWDALEDVVGDQPAGVVLRGTDILFEPSLGYRPFEALRRLARHGPIVATWFGTVDAGDAVRAHQGHPEYVRIRLDVPFVSVDGQGGTGS